ncbi:sulfatase family protein [Bacillus sp. Marseille-P3661]|uniref:sulfatase family protein n=1 Tax=Bacillus sp. Marseille-P3661 TaxID=1936234 RepID=UPI000C864026|nr:sulfatase-like hydrolase/transferase [Bacillus sp. Marseille-P3661]
MSTPNILIIYCDDLGYGDLGCFGSAEVKTPNIDSLAEDGIRFTDWYSNAPVCTPSRASLLTGAYPAKTGLKGILGGKRGAGKGLSLEIPTLAERLKECDYKTALFGKWHLGNHKDYHPNARGFDEFFGFLSGVVDYYSHIFYIGESIGVFPYHDLWHNDKEVWENGRYLTELITEKTVDFIEQQDNQPFFTYVAYNAPHFPMHAPQKYLDRYPDLPKEKAIMAAMISAMDDGVGEIVNALKRKGKYDNTLIVFSSDHGPSTETRNWLDGTDDLYYGGNKANFKGYKGSLFDGGIRVPTIMCYPDKLPKGKVNKDSVMTMDIVPTVLEFVTQDQFTDNNVDGESLVPMLTNHESNPHKQLFWEYNGQLAVREGKWKLVLNGKLDFSGEISNPIHLSDVENDPEEKVNLAGQFPELTQRLKKDLLSWNESINNTLSKENMTEKFFDPSTQ